MSETGAEEEEEAVDVDVAEDEAVEEAVEDGDGGIAAPDRFLVVVVVVVVVVVGVVVVVVVVACSYIALILSTRSSAIGS